MTRIERDLKAGRTRREAREKGRDGGTEGRRDGGTERAEDSEGGPGR